MVKGGERGTCFGVFLILTIFQFLRGEAARLGRQKKNKFSWKNPCIRDLKSLHS